MATSAPPALVVYSRSGCHLCGEMLAGLQTLQARFTFDVEVIDVDQDAALEARYGEDVPVLTAGGREICRHRLDPDRVAGWLEGAADSARKRGNAA